VAKEPSGEFMMREAGPMTWDAAWAWIAAAGGQPEPRVWYVYSNNNPTYKRYAVAKQPGGDFIIPVAGPMTWTEAWAWIASASASTGTTSSTPGSTTPPNPPATAVYGSLTVSVINAATGAPIHNATVVLDRASGKGNRIVFEQIPQGRACVLNVSAPGYKPSATSIVINGPKQMVEIPLTPETVPPPKAGNQKSPTYNADRTGQGWKRN